MFFANTSQPPKSVSSVMEFEVKVVQGVDVAALCKKLGGGFFVISLWVLLFVHLCAYLHGLSH